MIGLHFAYDRYLVQNKILKEKKSIDNRDTIIINQNYKYSKSLRRLYCHNAPVKLTKKQGILVDVLCGMHNKIVKYEVFIDRIWGNLTVTDNALRTLIYNLRKRLPDFPVTSYSKVGYSLLTE